MSENFKNSAVAPQPFHYTHINVWGFPYEMQAESAVVTLQYLREEDGTYLRAANVRFCHLQYESDREDNEKIYKDIHAKNSWGYPGMMIEEDDWITNRLLFAERRFESREAMEQDMANPDQNLKLAGFFNEIFGDG